jgi:hypothetical protein
MLLGNWEEVPSTSEVELVGRVNILADKNSILEIAITDDSPPVWYTVYNYPNKAEAFEISLSTLTRVRVTTGGGGVWAYSRFNEMSG